MRVLLGFSRRAVSGRVRSAAWKGSGGFFLRRLQDVLRKGSRSNVREYLATVLAWVCNAGTVRNCNVWRVWEPKRNAGQGRNRVGTLGGEDLCPFTCICTDVHTHTHSRSHACLYAIRDYDILCYIMFYHGTIFLTILCCSVLCHSTWHCFVVLQYKVFYHIVSLSCYTSLCHTVLCYDVLPRAGDGEG